MNLKNIALSAGVLIAGFAATALQVNAQGPLYDKVIVDLPYRVTLNETVLEPGHYVIRQLDSAGGGSRVLQIFTDNGMRLKTSSMTIPTLDNNTPENTRVILHHYGNDYYFDKIWIQGKNYGYEFPLPAAVKARERERMEPYTVAAKYETATETDQSSSTSASSRTSTDNSSVNTTPVPAASTDTTASSASNNSATTVDQSTTSAQSTPSASSSSDMNSNRNMNSAPAMPHTAGNWLSLLLSGGMLSGAGMLLRRK